MLRWVWRTSEALQSAGFATLRNTVVQQSARLLTSASSLESVDATGLPLEQRCKNLLAGNWRAQLTMVNHLLPWQGDEPQLNSGLITYASPRGFLPPALLLTEGPDSGKIEGLSHSRTISLTIGRIDPPALISLVRDAGMQLPCLSLLGEASDMSDKELGYTLRRAQKVFSRISGFPTDWEERLEEKGTRGYSLNIQSARYVDMTGKQHNIPPEEIDRAFLDPLALGQVRLLSSVNSDQEQQHALRMFCAAYMTCSVSQALMTQADRRGFTILAQPLNQGDGSWREFRIAFNREMSDVDAFMKMMKAMQQEAESMLVESK